MIETIYRCDHCNSVIETEGVMLSRFNVIDGDGYGEARHLCPECAERVAKWISCNGALTVAKEKAHAGGRPKVEIDIPKAKALRDAGWTLQNIADEMNVGKSVVQRALKEAE